MKSDSHVSTLKWYVWFKINKYFCRNPPEREQQSPRRRFLQGTSLHGWFFISKSTDVVTRNQTEPISRRSFWLLVIVLSKVAAFFVTVLSIFGRNFISSSNKFLAVQSLLWYLIPSASKKLPFFSHFSCYLFGII